MSELLNLENILPAENIPMAEKISFLEKECLKQPQVSCPVVHRFGPGVYMRELTVPSGTLVIGHLQNFEHTNIFLKGRVTVINDDGSHSELKAPMIFVGKPGRKIGFVHEEMVWLNVYKTDETDIEKLESHFLTKSDAFLENAVEIKKIGSLMSDVNQKDFFLALSEIGVSPETVRQQSENQDDMTRLPLGGYKIKVAKSDIEGQGLFATADIEPGEIIAQARISGKRTIAGRFTNHAAKPNAKMAYLLGDIFLVSLEKISGCKGGLDGKEITINYRESFALTKSIGNGVEKCLE